jgi:tripartite-type tricarboxylate transporter receptor subunit TctC
MKLIKIILLCITLLSNIALADTHPSKPVRIVTNLPVGSGPDIFVRKLSQMLESHWKVPVTIDNKPGGAGLIALEQYLRTPSNGHTIFYGDFGVFVTTPILYDKENLIQQLKPLTIGYNSAWMIVTPSSIQSFADLKNKILGNPKFGSWGVGSGGHLCGQELSAILQVTTVHVPYKDHGPWFADTSNGLLAFGCTSVGSSESYYRSGKFNYVATTSNKRDPAYPDVPTVKELTGHTFEAGEVFSAFYIHAQTDEQIYRKLEKDLRTFIQHKDMVELVKTLRGYPVSNTSEEMNKLRNDKVLDYKKLIKKYSISVN